MSAVSDVPDLCDLSDKAGTTDTAISFFLNQHETVKELVFCLDNDAAGREAANNMVKKYAEKGYCEKGYCTHLEFSHGKDFNEDLQGLRR